MIVFVDTWAWLALALRRDQHHQAAKKQHVQFVAEGRRYVTTDFVLVELITQLYRTLTADRAELFVTAVLAAIESGAYQLERITPERFADAWLLRRQYADKPAISFTDLSSMAVMRELGIREVFTGDDDFRQANMGFELRPSI